MNEEDLRYISLILQKRGETIECNIMYYRYHQDEVIIGRSSVIWSQAIDIFAALLLIYVYISGVKGETQSHNMYDLNLYSYVYYQV